MLSIEFHILLVSCTNEMISCKCDFCFSFWSIKLKSHISYFFCSLSFRLFDRFFYKCNEVFLISDDCIFCFCFLILTYREVIFSCLYV